MTDTNMTMILIAILAMTGSLGTLLFIFDRKQEARSNRIEARIDEQNRRIDEQNRRIDEQNRRIDEQNARFDARIDEQNARFDARIDEQDRRFEARFDRMDAEIKHNRVSQERIQATLDYMLYGPGGLPVPVARAREGLRFDDSEDDEQGNHA